MTMNSNLLAIVLLASSALMPSARGADAPTVRTVRVPDGGVQPQSAVDEKGVVHLIYLKGDPARSDIFYVHSSDGGDSFSAPVRVNSHAGAAIAIGTVRGAHMALGRNGRVHVAWMGSSAAEPKAAGKNTPMLYTRLRDDGTGFEPERNLIQNQPGLDGGGSIAADNAGNVYVGWHAPLAKGDGEKTRQVWVTHSSDDGITFSAEQSISAPGGCGCCGLRLLASNGSLYALFRNSDGSMQRDMVLIRLDTRRGQSRAQIVGKTQSAQCVMSTSALAAGTKGNAIGAWEANGQIYFSPVASNDSPITAAAVPGNAGGRKHPALAVNSSGQSLVVWAEGTGWQRGGNIAWQVYDADGRAIGDDAGRARNLPAWGTPTAFARKDGSFVIVY